MQYASQEALPTWNELIPSFQVTRPEYIDISVLEKRNIHWAYDEHKVTLLMFLCRSTLIIRQNRVILDGVSKSEVNLMEEMTKNLRGTEDSPEHDNAREGTFSCCHQSTFLPYWNGIGHRPEFIVVDHPCFECEDGEKEEETEKLLAEQEKDCKQLEMQPAERVAVMGSLEAALRTKYFEYLAEYYDEAFTVPYENRLEAMKELRGKFDDHWLGLNPARACLRRDEKLTKLYG